ncbi:SPOR domain-containing protein [Streptomyces sp. NPDC007088]|uniref:SPOR domain-containing protein n=1 Tax=Streptomyces sp. NPDC007088 TaxID=3364773 RepID=UPI003691AD0A
MTDSGATLPWHLIRRDDGKADSYRVGQYATRAEAERRASTLDKDRIAERRLYAVEHANSVPGAGS